MPTAQQMHAYWRDRAKEGGSTWSDDRWLDWEHATVVRRALKRIWPAGVDRVLDVGAGDMKWSRWMMNEFDVYVLATDPFEWHDSPEVITGGFAHVAATELLQDPQVREFDADMVVFLNSLTCVHDWQTALAEAARIAPRILVFDNLIDPVAPWQLKMVHRVAIPNGALTAYMSALGYEVEAAVAGDWWHRQLFLKTPAWMHRWTAYVTAALDWWAAHRRSPTRARHSAWLFSDVR